MGIDADRFVYAVPQGTYCILCNMVLEDPIEIIECGHFVCNHCWDTWLENNKNTAKTTRDMISCPYCNIDIDSTHTRKSKMTWSLIQNLNVYCTKKSDGCESIYKLGFDDLHVQKCVYHNAPGRKPTFETEPTKCDTCNQTLSDSSRSHSCVKELLQTLKKQCAEITNLEHENTRLVFKLTTCEKAYMEERAELEGQYFEESLKYGKEIRDLRTRLACLQGELSRKRGQSEAETLHVDLYRLNGSLGFNIIGGASKDEGLSSGIYVSRLVEGGAADRPGKLQLHDCILEVDGVDLRHATHELAVQTFKNSGDPVKMVIQRTLQKTKSCDATTQTFGVMFALTGGDQEEQDKTHAEKSQPQVSNNKKNTKWINVNKLAESAHFSDDGTDIIIQNSVQNKDHETQSTDQYDSAYDTLLTQKSSRSNTRSPSIAEQSDCSFSTLKSENSSDRVVLRNKITSDDNSSDGKRHSTFFVIPTSDDQETIVEDKSWHDLQSATECEAEYEFEYEEVSLRKEGGKLGMVLCYGGDEKDVAVYVGDLEEDSVADLSGKVMVGDQIVQINGSHVSDVEQAYTMLQDADDITLVVARAVYEQATDFYDEAEETDLDMLDCINEESESAMFSDKSSATYMSSTSSKSPSPKPTKKEITSPKSLPTSPLNSMSTSTANQFSPEIQRARAMTLSPVHSPKNDREFKFPPAEKRGRSISVNDSSSLDEKSDHKRTSSADSRERKHEKEKDSKKHSLKNFMKSKLGTSSEKKLRSGSHSDDSTELNKIPRCDSTGSNNSSKSNRSSGKENSTPTDQLKAKLKEQKNMSKLKAYMDSPSLQRHRVNNNMVVNQPPPPQMVMNPSAQFLYQGQMINVPLFTQPMMQQQQRGIQQYQPVMIPTQQMNTTPYINQQQQHKLSNRNSMTASVSSLRSAMKNSTMNSGTKTNKKVHIDPHPGWNETERRVWEEFKIIQSMESSKHDTHNSMSQHHHQQQQQQQDIPIMDPAKVEAEWRVRRSKDGKHVYIKKTNSSRTKILKDRAQQINEERCGITTDDDAFTVYQGRYWRSDQRKKQLHRHNDRRKKIMEKVAIKANYENKTEKAMAEMVQRRMMPGTVFDNFLTVEEILSQRNRAGIFEGPIHVTTI